MKLLAAVGSDSSGTSVPIEDLVDKAAANVSSIFADRPLAEAPVRNELGTIYYNLGLMTKSGAEFSAALEIWEGALGPDHPDTLKAVNNLGQSLMRQERWEEAEPYYRRAYEGRLRVLGEEDPYTLASMNNLGRLLQETGRLDAAIERVH